MKYCALIYLMISFNSSFTMDGPGPEKATMFFLWKRVTGVEIKAKYLFKERKELSELDDSDLNPMDLRELKIANYAAMKKCREEWDRITDEIRETKIFNQSELDKVFLSFSIKIFRPPRDQDPFAGVNIDD